MLYLAICAARVSRIYDRAPDRRAHSHAVPVGAHSAAGVSQFRQSWTMWIFRAFTLLIVMLCASIPITVIIVGLWFMNMPDLGR